MMAANRALTILSSALLAVLLAGCQISVTPGRGLPPGFEITNAGYTTNHAGPNGTRIICDNRTTELTYWFDYRGDLRSWTSYLRGEVNRETTNRETFYPGDRRVRWTNRGVEVTYTIRPGTAPLSVDGAFEPQAIGVRPRTWAVRLILQVNGYDRGYDLLSAAIPLVGEC